LADNPYAGSWASGGNLNTARIEMAGGGSQTAGIVAGGDVPPATANTELYNGSSWTETADLNTARNLIMGAGSYTSFVAAGGNPNSPASETWDGSSWTEIAEMNTTRSSGGSAGADAESFIAFGGTSPIVAITETWNGSSWTEVADMNTARQALSGSGSQTAAIGFGGTPPITAITETWNGSSWTEVSDLNTARTDISGAGSSTAALAFAGLEPPRSAKTESWDGSSWTEVADLATAKASGAGQRGTSASNTSTLFAGGKLPSGSPNYTNQTEEWSFTGIDPSTPAAGYANAITGDFYYNSTTGQFKTVNTGGAPIGTWSSGGSVNTARRYGAGIGSSSAGLIFGGSSPSPAVANTEQYNGTAWTEVNDLNAAQNAQGSAGTLTSGMSALGAQSPGANVEDWNGTSWASNPHSLNSGRQFPGGDGASNDSALMVGGEPSPNGALTEIYNGSSWTESGDLNTARNQLAAAGTVTALIAMGGNTGADAETFNGSAWTAVTDMNSGSGGISGSGTSTLALAFAGDPDVANTESWNGSAWTEVNDLSTGREFGASSNITGNTTAFLASGYTTTLVSNTEEWAAADFQIKTVTTS